MTVGDYIILAVIAAAVFFAVRSLVRQRKRGGCGCGCSGCSGCPMNGNCSKRRLQKEIKTEKKLRQ